MQESYFAPEVVGDAVHLILPLAHKYELILEFCLESLKSCLNSLISVQFELLGHIRHNLIAYLGAHFSDLIIDIFVII